MNISTSVELELWGTGQLPEEDEKMKVVEGYMPFMGYRTYYRVVGECKNGKKPLILMHGGPGSTHNYFEVLDKLAEEGRAIVMYDQLGCGLSYVENRPDLWTKEIWTKELIALREHLGLDEVHLLGQSWGGMLELSYVCDYKPEGVKSLILSSTLPSARLWAEEQHRMIKFMPQEMQDAIAYAEKSGDYGNEEYLKANEEFMLRHCAGVPDPDGPECLTRAKVSGKEAYVIGWGPNEFTPLGNLRDFEYRDRLGEITQPSLIISGINDLCTPVVAKTMYDGIPNAKWELFRESRHACFVEETEKYIEIVNKWMEEHD